MRQAACSCPELASEVGPSGDLNRDEIVLLVSCEDHWTDKLKRDLGKYGARPADERPEKAIFVTNCSTKQTTQDKYKQRSRDELGIRGVPKVHQAHRLISSFPRTIRGSSQVKIEALPAGITNRVGPPLPDPGSG